MRDFEDKYGIKKISDIVVNREGSSRLVKWLDSFQENKELYYANKSIKGKDKKKIPFTACMVIIGPHGVGKSSCANTILEDRKYNIVKLNLNNIKLTKDIKSIISRTLNSSNIIDMMNEERTISKNAILIDEVEGVIGSNEKKYISELCKVNNSTWECPVLIISNDAHNKVINKIKKITSVTQFFPPTLPELTKIISVIKTKENMKIDINDKLISYFQQDVRKMLGILNNLKGIHGSGTITNDMVDQYCECLKKKDVDIALFKATENILQKYSSVNDCLRLYEMEKTLLPLMIHQNYVSHIIKQDGSDRDKYKTINKVSRLLSFGDVIDNYIYSDQNWNLQEFHGIYTCALPSYYSHTSGLTGGIIDTKFAHDLNRASIKRINKRNIVTSNKMFTDMNVTDYIYLSKIVKKLIDDNNILGCVELLKSYKIDLSHIELLLKIDKINGKVSLTPKQKKEFDRYLKL